MTSRGEVGAKRGIKTPTLPHFSPFLCRVVKSELHPLWNPLLLDWPGKFSKKKSNSKLPSYFLLCYLNFISHSTKNGEYLIIYYLVRFNIFFCQAPNHPSFKNFFVVTSVKRTSHVFFLRDHCSFLKILVISLILNALFTLIYIISN